MFSTDANLRVIADEFWAWKLKEFPEQATRNGFHQYDDKLESFAPHSFSRRLVSRRHCLCAWAYLGGRYEQIKLRVVIIELEREEEKQESKEHRDNNS